MGLHGLKLLMGLHGLKIIDGITWNENNLWGNMEEIIGGITLYGMIDGK